MTLSEAIRSFMAHGDIDQSSGSAYSRMQRLIMSQLGELRLNVSPDVRSVVLEIASDFSVKIPNDATRIYKVGRLLSNGMVRVMGEDERCYEDTKCDCPGCSGSGDESAEVDTPYCYATTFHNFADGPLYGMRDDKFLNGKWSQHESKIVFSSGYDVREGAKVVVEYETSNDGFSVIPDEDIEMLRNKVLYEFFRTSRPSVAQTYFYDFKRAIMNKVHREVRMPVEWWVAQFSGYANVPQ